LDFLEVGMADTAGLDTDEQFAGSDLRRRDGLDRDSPVARVDGGAHRGGHARGRSDRIRSSSLPERLPAPLWRSWSGNQAASAQETIRLAGRTRRPKSWIG